MPANGQVIPRGTSTVRRIECREVIDLDLRNNNITVGELLDDARARAVFQRRFGKWMKHPMLAAGRSLTLGQLMELAKVYLPQKTIQETWNELHRL